MQVEIWSDVACPWCYIGKRRFEAGLARFAHRDEVQVTWRSFQLDPGLPGHFEGTELEYLSERKGMPAERVTQMFEHVTAEAAGVGLRYDFDRIVVANSWTAHRFLHLAKEQGLGDAAKEAVMSAHFEHGRDIGDVDVLVGIGTAIGLDGSDVRATLAGDRFGDDVRADIAEAAQLGVSGVPFFVIDRAFGLSGAQPADTFLGALQQAWTASHPLMMVPGLDASMACGPDGCDVPGAIVS